MEATRASAGTSITPTVDFTEDAVKGYLDKVITHWRACPPTEMQSHYIDAYQSLRLSIFGELLQKEGE
jgi:hypothetical protein